MKPYTVIEKYLSKARRHLKTERHLNHYCAVRELLIQLVDEVRDEKKRGT